jgi:hypothetical protein
MVLLLCVLLSVFWPSPGRAITAGAGTCDVAAEAAERSHSLPAGILAAIGRVESGRVDAAGHVAPWPWTIDAAGSGAYLPSATAAVASVQALQQRGLRNIDVGCFQVNLQQHPDAFPTLEAAFDPQTNADYAAGFLSALRQRTGSWDAAIAAYHSADPALGIPYRGQVFAQWGEGAPPADAATAARTGGFVVIAGVRVWTPSTPGLAPRTISIDPDARMLPTVTSLTK